MPEFNIKGMLWSMVLGVLGLLGFRTSLIKILIFGMALDFAVGMMVAAVGKSKKSAHGGIDSNVGFRGIVKKSLMLALVGVGGMVDYLIGSDVAQHATMMFFTINEMISITENAAMFGLNIPKRLTDILDQLKE